MKYVVKTNPHGQVYLPAPVRKEVLNGEEELEFHPNNNIGLIAPKGTDPEKILTSLKTLLFHFRELKEEDDGNEEK